MKIPRWIKISSGVLLVLILCFGAYIYWELSVTHPFPLPDLARDLPSKFTEGNSVFNDRVQNKFGRTQKEIEVVEELRKEGFMIIAGINDAGRRQAILEGNRFPCSLRWEVSWLVDKNGMISDLAGKYGEDGCL